jgi:hypothetical protein
VIGKKKSSTNHYAPHLPDDAEPVRGPVYQRLRLTRAGGLRVKFHHSDSKVQHARRVREREREGETETFF